MSDILVLVTEAEQLGKLATMLKLDQAGLDTLVVGDRALAEEAAAIAASVKWIDAKGKPAENYADAVAQAVEQVAPKAVLSISTPGSRAALGVVSCAWDAPAISNVVAVSVSGDIASVDHMVLNNRVVETLELPVPAVLLVDALSLKADETSKNAPCSIEEIIADSADFVEVLSVEPVAVSAVQNAEIIVSVGRGIKDGDSFAKAQQLCETLGGEMGCSMPVASELGLLPRDRYCGMSGKRVEPKLYIALGISGLTHHVIGVKNSRAIVVVNKDPKAFFFENSDYGIVGDVAEIIPELDRAFKAAL